MPPEYVGAVTAVEECIFGSIGVVPTARSVSPESVGTVNFVQVYLSGVCR